MVEANIRFEEDSIGKRELPAQSLYGIHTLRAMENFPISGIPLSHFPELVSALAVVKEAAAVTNGKLGALQPQKVAVIVSVCRAIRSGKHHAAFVVDMIQGGAGTSTNMNANEVVTNLALLEMGEQPGSYDKLNPNDHVNLSQSTNDVYPTAIRLAIITRIGPLQDALRALQNAFFVKAHEFSTVMKVGRTQLQDAVPMTLGSEFRSFAATVGEDIERLSQLGELLHEVNLGGTAIGTSINAVEGYSASVVAELAVVYGAPLRQSADLIEASSDLGAFVTFSSVLKRIAVKLSKICNDLRLLSSGPRAGFGEISLPAVQAGSSIMPGKVNPVIPEMVNQVAYQVIGADLTVTMAAEAGQMQLNAMEPIAAYSILNSMRLLQKSIEVLTEKCVIGITANEQRCRELLDGSLVLVTALVPYVGYAKAVKIAKAALAANSSVLDAALASGLDDAKALDALRHPERLLGPQ